MQILGYGESKTKALNRLEDLIRLDEEADPSGSPVLVGFLDPGLVKIADDHRAARAEAQKLPVKRSSI